ncbi:unnamed protein product, partial [Brenthis ino]
MVENSLFEETNVSLEEWSDEKCYKIAFQDNFPSKVKNIDIQKSIVSRFLKFYLSGKVQKGLSVTDIIFSTISIMPTTWNSENVLWHDYFYDEEGTLFFVSPEDKLTTEVKNIMKNRNKLTNIQLDDCQSEDIINDSITYQSEVKSPNCSEEKVPVNVEKESVSQKSQLDNLSDSDMSRSIKKITWFSSKSVYSQTNKANSTNSDTIAPVENAAFCASINKLFNKWDNDECARAYLKYYFGLTGLILMRTLILPYHKVMSAFTNNFFRSLQQIIFNNYSIPDKTCVKKSFKTFRKMDNKTQIMFARLVIQSILLDGHRDLEHYIKNVLKFGLMTHTANFKMDLIKMLQEVAIHTYSFDKLFEMLNVEELTNSWERFNNFLKKYMSEHNSKTIHWARVIESNQFEYLSCSNNFEFAVVIAVLIEKFSGHSGIWNAKWVKSGNNLQVYKELGLKIYKKYMKMQFVDISCIFSVVVTLT